MKYKLVSLNKHKQNAVFQYKNSCVQYDLGSTTHWSHIMKQLMGAFFCIEIPMWFMQRDNKTAKNSI